MANVLKIKKWNLSIPKVFSHYAVTLQIVVSRCFSNDGVWEKCFLGQCVSCDEHWNTVPGVLPNFMVVWCWVVLWVTLALLLARKKNACNMLCQFWLFLLFYNCPLWVQQCCKSTNLVECSFKDFFVFSFNSIQI